MDRKKLLFESNLKNNSQDLIVGGRETKATINEIRSRDDSIRRGSSKQPYHINNKSYDISTKTSGSFIITKDNEVSYLKKKIDELQFRLDSQEAKLKARDKEIAYQQSQIKQFVLEMNEVQIIEDNYKEEISVLNKELSQWKEKYFANLKEYQFRQAQLSRQSQQEQAMMRKKYEEMIEQQQREIESIEIRFENERDNLYKALDLQNTTMKKNDEMKELMIKLEERDAETHQLQERIQVLEKNKEELKLHYQQQTSKLNEQIKKCNYIEQEVKSLQQQLQGKDKQINTLQSQIGEQKKKTNQQDQEKLQHLENLNNQLVQQISLLEDQVAKFNQQPKDVQKIQSLDKENENLQMIIYEQKIQNHDLKQQIKLFQEEINQQKEQNQNITKTTQLEQEIKDYKRLLSELKEQNGKLLNQQVNFEEINEELIILKKNNQELKQQHAEEFKIIETKCQKIKQLEQEVNQLRQENLIFSSQKSQCEELEQKIQELNKQLEKLHLTNKEKDAQILQKQDLLQQQNLNSKDFEKLITQQKAENMEYLIQNKQLTNQVVLLQKENEEFQQELLKYQTEIDELTRIHEENLIKINSLENEKQQLKNTFDHHQKEIQKKDAEKLSNFAQLENENAKLYQQRNKLQDKIGELEETANQKLKEINQMIEQNQELFNQLQTQQQELETLNWQLQNVNSQSQYYQNNLIEKEELLIQLQSKNNKLIDQNEELQIIIKQLNNTYESQIIKQNERIQELEQNLEALNERNDQEALINKNLLLQLKNQELENQIHSIIDDYAKNQEKLEKQLLNQEHNKQELKLKLVEWQAQNDELQIRLELQDKDIERLQQIKFELQDELNKQIEAVSSIKQSTTIQLNEYQRHIEKINLLIVEKDEQIYFLQQQAIEKGLIKQETEQLKLEVSKQIELINQLEQQNQNYEAQLQQKILDIEQLNLQQQLIELNLKKEIEDIKNKEFEAIKQQEKNKIELLKYLVDQIKEDQLSLDKLEYNLQKQENDEEEEQKYNKDMAAIQSQIEKDEEKFELRNEQKDEDNNQELDEQIQDTKVNNLVELKEPEVKVVQIVEQPQIELDNRQKDEENFELRNEQKDEDNNQELDEQIQDTKVNNLVELKEPEVKVVQIVEQPQIELDNRQKDEENFELRNEQKDEDNNQELDEQIQDTKVNNLVELKEPEVKVVQIVEQPQIELDNRQKDEENFELRNEQKDEDNNQELDEQIQDTKVNNLVELKEPEVKVVQIVEQPQIELDNRQKDEENFELRNEQKDEDNNQELDEQIQDTKVNNLVELKEPEVKVVQIVEQPQIELDNRQKDEENFELRNEQKDEDNNQELDEQIQDTKVNNLVELKEPEVKVVQIVEQPQIELDNRQKDEENFELRNEQKDEDNNQELDEQIQDTKVNNLVELKEPEVKVVQIVEQPQIELDNRQKDEENFELRNEQKDEDNNQELDEQIQDTKVNNLVELKEPEVKVVQIVEQPQIELDNRQKDEENFELRNEQKDEDNNQELDEQIQDTKVNNLVELKEPEVKVVQIVEQPQIELDNRQKDEENFELRNEQKDEDNNQELDEQIQDTKVNNLVELKEPEVKVVQIVEQPQIELDNRQKDEENFELRNEQKDEDNNQELDEQIQDTKVNNLVELKEPEVKVVQIVEQPQIELDYKLKDEDNFELRNEQKDEDNNQELDESIQDTNINKKYEQKVKIQDFSDLQASEASIIQQTQLVLNLQSNSQLPDQQLLQQLKFENYNQQIDTYQQFVFSQADQPIVTNSIEINIQGSNQQLEFKENVDSIQQFEEQIQIEVDQKPQDFAGQYIADDQDLRSNQKLE
ncbi:unnamed protein product [Paramecium primaurelia]|uniref:Uncharacterized protein n=1 Tax=Paramecium primaurelia TaxID=5886 RepID=A0A8S1LSY5_PARPR|nr:unnamed protein product [Paramecium primaurelia]